MLKIFEERYPALNVVGYRNGYFSPEDEKHIQEDIKEKNQILCL